MRNKFTAHWLVVCLLVLAGRTVLAFEPANYTTVPDCAFDCVISAFSSGMSSCLNALDTPCICVDDPYQDFLYSCVTANCTVKEQLTAKKISAVQCGVPMLEYKDLNLGSETFKIKLAMYSLFALASLLMIVRVAVKATGHGGGWSVDDWLMSLAYICLIPMFIASIILPDIAFGHNVWDVQFADITTSLELFYIADQFYTCLITLTKLSMCFFFLRIFSHTRSFRRSVYGVIALNIVVGLVFQLCVAFQCQPISAFWTYWTGELDEYYCFELYTAAVAQAAVSIVIDFVMIGLPIRETLKVKLSVRKKIGVMAMFAMGFIWTIVGTIRAVIIWDTRQRPGQLYNVTVEMAPLGYWTVFEACIAVMCACLPDSRFFIGRLIPKTFGWTTRATKDINDRFKNKIPYNLSDLSARQQLKMRGAGPVGMITVTTEFDLKSTCPESVERLTDSVPRWVREEGWKGPGGQAVQEQDWPLRPDLCLPR